MLGVIGEVGDLHGGLVFQAGELDAEVRARNAAVYGHDVVLDAQVHGVGDGEERDDGGDDHNGQERGDADDRAAAKHVLNVAAVAVVRQINHDHGHVVRAAGGERGVHQVVGADLGGGRLRGDALDVPVGDHGGKAI